MTFRRPSLFAPALLLAACSSSHATGSSAAGSTSASSSGPGGASASASSSSASKGVTVTASTGTGTACSGSLNLGAQCNACMDASCCAEESACSADANCVTCLDMANPTCAMGAGFQALDACLQSKCKATCPVLTPKGPACDAPLVSPSNGSCITIGGNVKCNPFTNQGCNVQAGEICDSGGNGAYACFPPPSSNDICMPCSSVLGFCKSGLTCVGECFKLCCNDGDCGSGHCDTTHAQYAPAGVCTK